MIARPATLADVTELVRVINLAYVVEAEMFVGQRTSEADVRMLAVDPTHQGRGLGRALVRATEKYARNVGCDVMHLDVVDLRSELTVFYGSLGYEAIGDSPYPRPEQTKRPVRLVHMSKALIDAPTRA